MRTWKNHGLTLSWCARCDAIPPYYGKEMGRLICPQHKTLLTRRPNHEDWVRERLDKLKEAPR